MTSFVVAERDGALAQWRLSRRNETFSWRISGMSRGVLQVLFRCWHGYVVSGCPRGGGRASELFGTLGLSGTRYMESRMTS